MRRHYAGVEAGSVCDPSKSILPFDNGRPRVTARASIVWLPFCRGPGSARERWLLFTQPADVPSECYCIRAGSHIEIELL